MHSWYFDNGCGSCCLLDTSCTNILTLSTILYWMQDLSIKFMTPKLKVHILDNFPGPLTNKSSHSQGSNRTQFFVWSNSSQTVYLQCTGSITLSCIWSNGTAWKRKNEISPKPTYLYPDTTWKRTPTSFWKQLRHQSETTQYKSQICRKT